MYTPMAQFPTTMTAVTNITVSGGNTVVCGEVAILEGGGLLTLV